MNFETIKMEIASNPQYVSVVRLTTSGIANKIGFCLEDIEDIKVAVSEACTNAIKHSLDNKFSVEYTIFENGLTIGITDSGKGYDVNSIDEPNLEEPKESGYKDSDKNNIGCVLVFRCNLYSKSHFFLS